MRTAQKTAAACELSFRVRKRPTLSRGLGFDVPLRTVRARRCVVDGAVLGRRRRVDGCQRRQVVVTHRGR